MVPNRIFPSLNEFSTLDGFYKLTAPTRVDPVSVQSHKVYNTVGQMGSCVNGAESLHSPPGLLMLIWFGKQLKSLSVRCLI